MISVLWFAVFGIGVLAFRFQFANSVSGFRVRVQGLGLGIRG